jgi:protein-S-isoprenylcysteine O-methyltransferase Ste14
MLVEKRARWGLLLQCVAYSLLWQGPFWNRTPNAGKVACAVFFFTAACILSWTATRSLGRHFRLDAALNQGHELIRTGPYRFVRHPLYTSLLFVQVASGCILATFPMLLASLVIFLTGTVIRVRLEDALLAAHFGDVFHEYCREVPAFLPYLHR